MALTALAALLVASSPAAHLSPAEDLPSRFSAARGETRVVLILSPTSSTCLRGARMVERQVMSDLIGKPVRAYVVWTPVLMTDSREAAQQAAQTLTSVRVEQFWDPARRLARQYGRLMQLPAKRQLAWNVYLVHGPKAVWRDGPPVPDDWMHQLGSDERRLSAESLLSRIGRRLPSARS